MPAAIADQGRVGSRMVAFYATLYFAALWPEEAPSVVIPRSRHPLTSSAFVRRSWKASRTRFSLTPSRKMPVVQGGQGPARDACIVAEAPGSQISTPTVGCRVAECPGKPVRQRP